MSLKHCIAFVCALCWTGSFENISDGCSISLKRLSISVSQKSSVPARLLIVDLLMYRVMTGVLMMTEMLVMAMTMTTWITSIWIRQVKKR